MYVFRIPPTLYFLFRLYFCIYRYDSYIPYLNFHSIIFLQQIPVRSCNATLFLIISFCLLVVYFSVPRSNIFFVFFSSFFLFLGLFIHTHWTWFLVKGFLESLLTYHLWNIVSYLTLYAWYYPWSYIIICRCVVSFYLTLPFSLFPKIFHLYYFDAMLDHNRILVALGNYWSI